MFHQGTMHKKNLSGTSSMLTWCLYAIDTALVAVQYTVTTYNKEPVIIKFNFLPYMAP